MRGLELKRLFVAAGLKNVRIDDTGNVLGDRPGAQPHPHLVIAAHLDTVFPEGTDVHVKRSGMVMTAPGIGDDGRGLAAMLAMIDAMRKSNVRTRGSLTFVADVGEEGLGDSRGTKALFATTLKNQIDEFISIDGDRLNGVVNVGVGSFRYKVTFNGPGGHSYGAFGLANPANALGRAIAHIADIDAPTKPKTTYNVGRIGGGTSVNSIPFEAWFEFDERSADPKSLDIVDAKFKAAVQAGLEEENAFPPRQGQALRQDRIHRHPPRRLHARRLADGAGRAGIARSAGLRPGDSGRQLDRLERAHAPGYPGHHVGGRRQGHRSPCPAGDLRLYRLMEGAAESAADRTRAAAVVRLDSALF